MISNMNNQKIELDEFNINEDVRQVLLGSLLGDGSLKINKGGKNAYYYDLHSAKQKEYLIWKNQFLKIFDTKFHEYSTYDKRTSKTYYSILLWSKTHTILTHYYNILYKERGKTISKELVNEIGIFGLAVWYMDDGCYHYGDGRCQLGTDALSYQEHLLIKDWLRNSFGITIQIHKRMKNGKKSYNTVFTKDETNKLLKLIEPFIIPCMFYKLGHIKEENFPKINIHNNRYVEYRKLKYQNNKEQSLERSHAYYRANKERLLKDNKLRYLKNREKILKQKKEYHIRNRQIILEKQKLYYQKNKDKFKKYYEKNKEMISQRKRGRKIGPMEDTQNATVH